MLYYALRLVNKIFALSRAMRSKAKTNHVLQAFSRAWHRLHVFALNSDWFIALFAPFVIGQSNYFSFCFTKLIKALRLINSSNRDEHAILIPSPDFAWLMKRKSEYKVTVISLFIKADVKHANFLHTELKMSRGLFPTKPHHLP